MNTVLIALLVLAMIPLGVIGVLSYRDDAHRDRPSWPVLPRRRGK